ncbi:MAG: hypothetical protein M3O70_22745 [Actinomycetota bacterium]|nr:hypothetical protein [Actinomycetota bacterium]
MEAVTFIDAVTISALLAFLALPSIVAIWRERDPAWTIIVANLTLTWLPLVYWVVLYKAFKGDAHRGMALRPRPQNQALGGS